MIAITLLATLLLILTATKKEKTGCTPCTCLFRRSFYRLGVISAFCDRARRSRRACSRASSRPPRGPALLARLPPRRRRCRRRCCGPARQGFQKPPASAPRIPPLPPARGTRRTRRRRISWYLISARRGVYRMSITDQGTGLMNRVAYEKCLRKSDQRVIAPDVKN